MNVKAIDTDKLRNDVSDLADQDYCGLYEIVWTLNSWCPDVPESEKIVHVRRVAEGLLHSGDYALYRTDEWPPLTYAPVPQMEARALVQTDDAFRIPETNLPPALFWITRIRG